MGEEREGERERYITKVTYFMYWLKNSLNTEILWKNTICLNFLGNDSMGGNALVYFVADLCLLIERKHYLKKY